MIHLTPLEPFLKRYFPIFMAAIFCGFLGGSAVVFLVEHYYLGLAPLVLWTSFDESAAALLACIITLCNFMMMYGRPQWVWGMVVFFVACLLIALPAIQYSLHPLLYAESLFWPLLGLLILNSRRHREMRGKFLELRYRRKRIREILRRRQRKFSG